MNIGRETELHRLIGSLTLATGFGAASSHTGSGLHALLNAHGVRIPVSITMMAVGCWMVVFSYALPGCSNGSMYNVRAMLAFVAAVMWVCLGALYFGAGYWSAVGWSGILCIFCFASLFRMITRGAR